MSPSPLTDFSQDLLSREPIADYLTQFIMTAQSTTNENSIVVALDSGWGTGKTSFINMWIKKLENTEDSPFICVKYNAWENDDSSDALIPILCSFQQIIDENTEDGKKTEESLTNILSTFGPSILGLFTQITCGVNVENAIETYKEYREKKLPDMILEEFDARQRHKALFQKLSEDIRGKHTYLLICIDELDRCRPTFAIETLEVVKHFFDLPNVIFVFSLDMQQLHRSIKTVYGDIDSMGYLQRFFDYQISLPKPDLERFLNVQLQDCEGDAFTVACPLLTSLAKKLSLSLRTLDVICKEYVCFLKRKQNVTKLSQSQFSKKYLKTYLTLFCMKYADPLAYLDLLSNGTTPDNRLSIVWVEEFVDQSVIGSERMNVYNKELMDTTISTIIQKCSENQQHKSIRDQFLDINEYRNELNDNICELTLSNAIYNNVEYGEFLPQDST